jgi:hypothetical protein
MKHGTYPSGFIKATETKTDPQLAKMFGVTPTTVRNWKKKLDIPVRPGNKVIHEKIDAMLKTAATWQEIKRKTGYSESAIKARKRELFGFKPRAPKTPQKEDPLDDIATSAPGVTVSREMRFLAACEAKAADRGMTLEEFKTKWLTTRTGQAWKNDMGF